MPYTPEHKAKTRARIVESARRLFNRHGFERVSIDQIMADAKLTRGGFYNHFGSKDELYAEAVASFATCNPYAKEAKANIADPRKLARRLVELYLGDDVLLDVESHCPLHALPSDVARAGREPREAYTGLIQGMIGIFRAALGSSREAERRAQTIVTLLVGGMVLARTTNDAALRKSLRLASRGQALAILDEA